MKQSESEFLESLSKLSALEQGAAIAHRIYVLTASRTGWSTRTPERWEELDSEARQYNIDCMQTWLEESELWDRFQSVIGELRQSRLGTSER